LPEAIEAVFPQTEIQNGIVHQLRNSFKYVPYKDRREITADLKAVYKAVTLEAAEEVLEEISAKWDKKYPVISRSWRQK